MYFSPYITALEENTKICPQKPAFKLPILNGKRSISAWRSVTYDQLYEKLNKIAKYWMRTLKLPLGSVVGIWVSGIPFSDFLHVFSIMRAGYIPHILNSEITSLDVVRALFSETSASVIIHAPSLAECASGLTNQFSCYPAIDAEELGEAEEDTDITSLPGSGSIIFNGSDTVMIIHTSGSTSGRPKLVRINQKYLQVNVRKLPLSEGGVTIPRLGSICHVGQLALSLRYFLESTCVVLLPWLDYTAEEIIQMHTECDLTVFTQYPPLLSETIRFAQKNSRLLEILQSYPLVFYTGGALNETEIEWCRKNKIALKTVLASTEIGCLMVSSLNNPTSLSLIKTENCSYAMLPIADRSYEMNSQSRLLELVVLPESWDCPDVSLCDPKDGKFHTRDIFEETSCGIYEYRGRLDDIITVQNIRPCDARYIENKVYALCPDLVATCVVVGTNRPSPALLVEPNLTAENGDRVLVARRIAERIKTINEGGYPHERISANHVLMVAKDGLVRNVVKRTVNRFATEAKFKDEIDALYAGNA